jgi:zinc transport system permease protein
LVVAVLLFSFFKELVFITFDEEAATVSGIPSRRMNTLLVLLTALTIALSIPIVGVLLISALIVLPISIALQFKKGFLITMIYAEVCSLFAVITGIFTAFSFNFSAGGTIVLILVALFILVLAVQAMSQGKNL